MPPAHIEDKVWPGKGKKPKLPATIELTVERKSLEFLVPKHVETPN